MARLAVIGCGPAGLMGAEVLARAGHQVHCFDAMATAGRKFLMAGKSGLNLTHAEPRQNFLSRYGSARPWLEPALEGFSPDDLRAWAHGLGISTFTGSSGRVFPEGMKAAPLLRAWLQRLRQLGVHFHMRHRWLGWQDGALRFQTPAGEQCHDYEALLLALGGASWSQLGSDGAWATLLTARQIPVAPFRPANCGFDVAWSPSFRERYAGQPVKAVSAACPGFSPRRGEFVISTQGVEGSLIYALSAPLRDALARDGQAAITLDLVPDRPLEKLAAELARPRGRDSLANHLRRRAGIEGVKAGLVRECLPRELLEDAKRLAAALKALPLPVTAPRPLEEAISSAGGLELQALDGQFMLKALPGVFCAGEMLDWEAPTGGYLLSACFATGNQAARGMLHWLAAGNGQSTAPDTDETS